MKRPGHKLTRTSSNASDLRAFNGNNQLGEASLPLVPQDSIPQQTEDEPPRIFYKAKRTGAYFGSFDFALIDHTNLINIPQSVFAFGISIACWDVETNLPEIVYTHSCIISLLPVGVKWTPNLCWRNVLKDRGYNLGTFDAFWGHSDYTPLLDRMMRMALPSSTDIAVEFANARAYIEKMYLSLGGLTWTANRNSLDLFLANVLLQAAKRPILSFMDLKPKSAVTSQTMIENRGVIEFQSLCVGLCTGPIWEDDSTKLERVLPLLEGFGTKLASPYQHVERGAVYNVGMIMAASYSRLDETKILEITDQLDKKNAAFSEENEAANNSPPLISE